MVWFSLGVLIYSLWWMYSVKKKETINHLESKVKDLNDRVNRLVKEREKAKNVESYF